MFCPKCATQNLDGASFCRSCGANISLVPQALSGHLPQTTPEDAVVSGRGRRKRGREVTLDQAFKNIFMGIAFLLVAFALANSIGRGWWFWMLLPAFSMMGTGIAQVIRLKEREKRTSLGGPAGLGTFPDRASTPPVRQVSRRDTGELMPPAPSVTEGTTRHLGVEAQTRHFDHGDQK
jgi:zinc-ribbon domain